jgi:hypothetical protein
MGKIVKIQEKMKKNITKNLKSQISKKNVVPNE